MRTAAPNVFPRPRAHRAWRRGFTLIEAAIATVVIGVGFTAMLQLLATGTVANRQAAELTTALNLAGNIHELAVRTTYDQLGALEGTHHPAVDAKLNSLSGMGDWSQVVDVSYVDESMLTKTVADTQYEPTSRVTVSILHNNKQVYRTSWLAAASQ